MKWYHFLSLFTAQPGNCTTSYSESMQTCNVMEMFNTLRSQTRRQDKQSLTKLLHHC